ncbi:MAG: ribosome biogenesis factor YjgA [Cellvibrio sp.]
MAHDYSDQEIDPSDYILSKSQVKRDMHKLQELGESFITMNEKQLKSLPLSEELLDAIYIARKMPPKEARRRQIQYIGRLMREGNHEEIQAAVEKLQTRNDQYVHRQHQIERYRDLLIENDKSVFQSLVSDCPNIDIQRLRQLVRNAQKEREENKPPVNARKLFGFIRDELAKQD